MLCTSKFQRSFDEATLQQGYRKIIYVDPGNYVAIAIKKCKLKQLKMAAASTKTKGQISLASCKL